MIGTDGEYMVPLRGILSSNNGEMLREAAIKGLARISHL
ncbi:hypothetical protein RintRC_7579 [Richelia intracellularis]|nr:hypothetical protein RintRC_7579 [Richelia intracellularis]